MTGTQRIYLALGNNKLPSPHRVQVLAIEAIRDVTEDHKLFTFKPKLLALELSVVVVVVSDVTGPSVVVSDAIPHVLTGVECDVTGWYVTVSSAKERVRVGVKRFCYFHSSGLWSCWCGLGTVIGIARMAKGRTVLVHTQRIRGTALVARLVGCSIHCLVFSFLH